MTVVTDNRSLNYEPMSSLLLTTLISAFTLITGLSIKDTITKGIELIAPNNATKEWIFTFATTVFFLFITVLLVYMFQDRVGSL